MFDVIKGDGISKKCLVGEIFRLGKQTSGGEKMSPETSAEIARMQEILANSGVKKPDLKLIK